MMKVVVCDGECDGCPLQGEGMTLDDSFRLTYGILVRGSTCLGKKKGIEVFKI